MVVLWHFLPDGVSHWDFCQLRSGSVTHDQCTQAPLPPPPRVICTYRCLSLSHIKQVGRWQSRVVMAASHLGESQALICCFTIFMGKLTLPASTSNSSQWEKRKEKEAKSACFSYRSWFSASHVYFCLHLVGFNLVTWPCPLSSEAGICSLRWAYSLSQVSAAVEESEKLFG